MKKIIIFMLTALALLTCASCAASTKPVNTENLTEATAGQTLPEEQGLPPETEESTSAETEGTETDTNPERAEQLVSSMTLEEKVGQLFLVRNPDGGAEKLIGSYYPGGIIFFGSDFADNTPEGVTSMTSSYQTLSANDLLLAADEEGGTVQRIAKYRQYRTESFLSPREAYAAGGWDRIVSDAADKAKLFTSLGLNFNLAPVADVCGDAGAFMYDRSFSGDVNEVSSFVSQTVSAFIDGGIGCALKHFPGYGSVSDTHGGIAYDSGTAEEKRERDFLPFADGIAAGAPCVLVSHVIVSEIDAENPASLSPEIHRILRDELGFDGVILTDDLAMQGVLETVGGSAGKAAVSALLAGNDMLCCTDYEEQIPAVLAAARSGEIPQELIDSAAVRIIKMKLDLGIIR